MLSIMGLVVLAIYVLCIISDPALVVILYWPCGQIRPAGQSLTSLNWTIMLNKLKCEESCLACRLFLSDKGKHIDTLVHSHWHSRSWFCLCSWYTFVLATVQCSFADVLPLPVWYYSRPSCLAWRRNCRGTQSSVCSLRRRCVARLSPCSRSWSCREKSTVARYSQTARCASVNVACQPRFVFTQKLHKTGTLACVAFLSSISSNWLKLRIIAVLFFFLFLFLNGTLHVPYFLKPTVSLFIESSMRLPSHTLFVHFVPDGPSGGELTLYS